MAVDQSIRVAGERKVLANLNKAILKIKGRTQAGIMDALAFVQEKADEKTPLKTGNLRGSYVTEQLVLKKDLPAGRIINTAEYALWVHEILENEHTIGEPRFLENAFLENTDKILSIISSRLRLKF